LIRAGFAAPKDRHDNQPTIRKLIVAHYRIAIVPLVTRTAESMKDGVRGHGAVQHLSSGVEPLTPLREDRQPGIHSLYDMVGTNGEAVVRGISRHGRPMRPKKPETQPVETLSQNRRRLFALRGLFGSSGCKDRRHAGLFPLSLQE
jgi:hypothetical protein